jgi:hypothetical protein
MRRHFTLTAVLMTALAVAVAVPVPAEPGGGGHSDQGTNNLSFPVIWSDGVAKALPGTFGLPVFEGEYWYWWPCPEDAELGCKCEAGTEPGVCLDGTSPPEGYETVYPQKTAGNVWQAESAEATDVPFVVDWIDWGDNLESVDWTTRSKIRTEVVLFQDLDPPLLGFEMRHVSGWGIDELWGTNTVTYDSAQATVYSACARFTIQGLDGGPPFDDTTWDASAGEWVGNDVGDTYFNGGVWEGGDGPGYYSAELNIKGKIIYGYTWDARADEASEGYYRLTFSFDAGCGGVASLNTIFGDSTQIMVPAEEEAVTESEPGGGGTPVIDTTNNLTYIDIFLYKKTGGGGGKPVD